MYSLSEENYLKAIFHLQKQPNQGVSTNALAEQMETKASSVTDMIKRLSEKDLVSYKKYKGVKLSSKGRNAAVQIIRKHRLWEVFLVDQLNFSWDEVHEVAEQLEHIKSKKLIRELDKFLDYPKMDPHGDPIPDEDGNIAIAEKLLLNEINPGKTTVCVGVKDTSTHFLKYLDKNNIALGKTIHIKEKEAFDESMLISIDHKELRISKMVSSNIYVKTKS